MCVGLHWEQTYQVGAHQHCMRMDYSSIKSVHNQQYIYEHRTIQAMNGFVSVIMGSLDHSLNHRLNREIKLMH